MFLAVVTNTRLPQPASRFSFIALMIFRGSCRRLAELGKRSVFHLICQRFYLKYIHPLQDSLPNLNIFLRFTFFLLFLSKCGSFFQFSDLRNNSEVLSCRPELSQLQIKEVEAETALVPLGLKFDSRGSN